MAANLRVVANAAWLSDDKSESQATETKKLDQLLIMPAGEFKAVEQAKPAYRMLVIVIAIHVAVLARMLIATPEDKVLEKVVTPMMVSLVNAPTVNEPQVVPEPELEQAKPVVVKKQIPVLKQTQEQPAQPVMEAASSQSAESKAAEQPVVAEAVASDNPIQAESAAHVAKEKVETVAEPVIEPPRFGAAYLNNPAPSYPPLARRLGEQGRVLLKVLVSENGLAESVQLDTSSGYEKLDRAAIEAVKKWSFIPAKRSNQPVSAYVLVPVKFSLSS